MDDLPRPRGGGWRRLGEAAGLLAACLLLAALADILGEGQAVRAFLGPELSFYATVLAACMAPGYVLSRLTAGGRPPDWLSLFGSSFGLGVVWLALPAALFLATGSSVRAALPWITAANALLVAAYLVRPPLGGKRAAAASPAGRAWTGATLWLAIAAAVSVVQLLSVALQRPRFTQAGDEWILMRAIRYFLDAPSIGLRWDFDVWGFILALFFELSGVDLFQGYRVLLPAVLILAAASAFLGLGYAIFNTRRVAFFALCLQALYCLSDMQPRGEGMGMAWLVRIMEDKYVALLIVVPLAQAAFLGLLRDGGGGLLARFTLLLAGGVLVQPLTAPWLGFTVGAMVAIGLWRRELALTPRAWSVLGAAAALALTLAWWLRSLRPEAYYRLLEPSWAMSGPLLALSRGQLLVLSTRHGWYMADPDLLSHPLMAAAVIAALALVRRARETGTRFLLVSTFTPLLVVYNPVTASLLGRIITPWMVYRLVWMVPVAFVLADGLDRVLLRLVERAHERGGWSGRWPGLLWIPPLLLVALVLHPRRRESWFALKQRNAVPLTAEERELAEAVRVLLPREARVLAPVQLGIHLPAWTSRVRPYPGLDLLRTAGAQVRGECEAFYGAPSLGSRERGFLERTGVQYVVTETATPIDGALRQARAEFQPLHENPRFSLYAWRPGPP